jgi:hypothetical protein
MSTQGGGAAAGRRRVEGVRRVPTPGRPAQASVTTGAGIVDSEARAGKSATRISDEGDTMAHHHHGRDDDEEILEEALELDGVPRREHEIGLDEIDEVGAPGVGVNVNDPEAWPDA